MIGLYSVGSFEVHNYVNLNVGLTLTLQQSVAYFLEWLITGIVIGLIYQTTVSGLPRGVDTTKLVAATYTIIFLFDRRA